MTIRYPKPGILERLGDSHCVIEASAGTGKTYTLEHLVVDLILKGIPLEKILVVTFTVKATLELKCRVRAKLEELVALEADAAPGAGCCWELDGPARSALQAALSSFDRATISTIHGFCQQVLQDGAFESGRQFNQQTVAAATAFDTAFKTLVRTRLAVAGQRPLFERALERLKGLEGVAAFLREAMREGDNLDLPDLEALSGPLEAFPEVAAAAFLREVEDHYAIEDAKRRPRGPMLAALAAGKVTGNSYRGMATRLRAVLRGLELGRASAIPGLFWAEADGEELGYLRDSFAKAGAAAAMGGLAEACAGLAEQACDFRAVLAAAYLPPLRAELERHKREEGLFDFDDMILLVHRAIMDPGGEPLVARLRERFQAALIDEFQDTDGHQWDIFRRVFLEGPEHRLILVGDPKQAIYGFRSGDLPTYLRAVSAVQKRTGRPLEVLTTNFRSTPELIEAYCEIFQGTPDSAFFTGANQDQWKGAVTCGRPGLALQDGQGRALPAIRVVEVEAGKTGPTRRALAASLAWAIRDTLHGAGALFGVPGQARAVRAEDIFVLTRSTKEGLEMARALRVVGVASAFFKQDGLFATAEAAAVRDLLLAIDNPLNESVRAKALLGPFFGLAFGEVEASRELAESHPILRHLFAWRDLARAGRFGDFFARLLADSGITQRLLFLDEGERALTNIHHLLELLQGEALGRRCSLLDLAVLMQRWIEGLERPSVEDGDAQRLEREAGAVQILTMHKSKGLEAPVVAVYGGFAVGGGSAAIHRYHDAQDRRRAWVGALKGAPEPTQERVAREQAEEWERLLYVALTRAKAQLILPRVIPGPAPRGPSPFDPSGDPKGPYGCVNRRLRGMLGLPSERIAHPRFRLDPALAEAGSNLLDPASRLASWNPLLPALPALPDFQALAAAGRPLWSFSYSSLAHGLNHPQGQLEDDLERTEPPAREAPEESGASSALGGARLGTLVHELLQAVPLDSFPGRSQGDWLADPGIARLLQELPPEARKAAGLWAFHAFAGRLPLPGGGSVVLAEAGPMLRELDFLTPYPGRQDLLTGSMDLLFQWQGLAYVLDWKSNRLAGYGPEALQRKVEEDYLLQVQAYAVTACRFLGIRSEADYLARFGGILYVFLRGLPAGGVWTLRPSWAELGAWERALAALPVDALIPAHAGGARHA